MVRTIITPNKPTISLDVPKDYIGRKIEVLVYAVDELQEQEPMPVTRAKFRGALHLTDEQYHDFQQHAANIRKEWE